MWQVFPSGCTKSPSHEQHLRVPIAVQMTHLLRKPCERGGFKCIHFSPRASQVALVVKNPPANAGDRRDTSWIPELGRSPEGGRDNPFQYSCLENPHGQRSLGGLQLIGSQRVRHDKWLSMHTHALVPSAVPCSTGLSRWASQMNQIHSPLSEKRHSFSSGDSFTVRLWSQRDYEMPPPHQGQLLAGVLDRRMSYCRLRVCLSTLDLLGTMLILDLSANLNV